MPNDVSATGHYRAYLRKPVKQQPGLDTPVIFENGGPRAFYVNIDSGCHNHCDCSGWGAFAFNRLNTIFTLGTGVLLDKLFGGAERGSSLGALGGSDWGSRFGSYNVGSFNIDLCSPGSYTYEAPPKPADKSKDKAVDDKAKAVDDKDKAVDDKDKAVDDKAKAVDDKDKAVDDKAKAVDDKEKTVPDAKIKELVDAIDGQNAGIITGTDTEEVKNADGVDNVRAGTSGDANKKDKATNGLYNYFTITDASKNQYTLGNPVYDATSGKITYTIVRKESNLKLDDTASGKGFEFNRNYTEGTKLTVEVKNNQIVVTNSSGEAIATKDVNRHFTQNA